MTVSAHATHQVGSGFAHDLPHPNADISPGKRRSTTSRIVSLVARKADTVHAYTWLPLRPSGRLPSMDSGETSLVGQDEAAGHKRWPSAVQADCLRLGPAEVSATTALVSRHARHPPGRDDARRIFTATDRGRRPHAEHRSALYRLHRPAAAAARAGGGSGAGAARPGSGNDVREGVRHRVSGDTPTSRGDESS
jgi:hypothetical protein